MEVILRENDAADWVYRGEGAANLVLSYIGSSPLFIGKVMRIRKAPRSDVVTVRSPSALTAHERLLWKDVDELISSSDKEIAGRLFVQHVMKPLLGSKFVDAGMHVLVSTEFLESVEKDIICQRPPWRVDNAQVDTQCDSVLLMSDHSVFSHGLGGGAEDTNFGIAKAFEDVLKSFIQANDGLCTESLLTLVAEALTKSGVLNQLLEVQKLDNVDIEGAIHAYYDITSQQCMVCRELGEEQAKKYTSLHSASLNESLRVVRDYLIAATAKDCSLMMCFRPRKDGGSGSEHNTVYLESTKQTFDFKADNSSHEPFGSVSVGRLVPA
ncbi:hypothetical protein TanjilG_12108 [Lupinus angustifolius]|uniref:Inositol-pentakisphosphate 2-kinase n=1 Tax=Lupinus angustifolius TaxID=3871 RepID=A0A1J7HDM0_LUPAN|nr:hypothetical protein TanjilG_12108 [Lupinus angustifolius]